MIDNEIKRYADSGDLTSLKYIFVDSLDVDPTFEHYEEAYNYCKAKPGLLEQHVELASFSNDPDQWTETYWARLKMDLKKNFSDQRMCHMRKVAKVFLADKVQRILAERQVLAAAAEQTHPQNDASLISAAPGPETALRTQKITPKAEREKERLNFQRQLKAEHRGPEEKQAKPSNGDMYSKKEIGIALVVGAVIVVVLLLLLWR